MNSNYLIKFRKLPQAATVRVRQPERGCRNDEAPSPLRIGNGGEKRAREVVPGERVEPERNVRPCRARPCAKYAVATPKGGEGKTTTALNLGAAMAKKNPTKRVLIIGGDPCSRGPGGLATVGRNLFPGGAPPIRGLDAMIDRELDGRSERRRRDSSDCISSTTIPNLHIMVAGRDLGNVKEKLNNKKYGQNCVLRNSRSFKALVDKYDYIFVDTEGQAADGSVLLRNILCWCNKIVVPVVPSSVESFDRVKELNHNLRGVQEELNYNVRFEKILLFTKVHQRGQGTEAEKNMMNAVGSWAGHQDFTLLRSRIPEDEHVRASATVQFRPVVEWHEKTSPAAKEYLTVAEFLTDRAEQYGA